MNPPVFVYPYDPTGQSPGNLVLAEPHNVPASGNRAIVLNHGAFYTRRMVVRNRATGVVLTPNVHYRAVQLFEHATLATGMEVCSVLVITPETNGQQFEVDYQCLGGDYSASVESLQRMIEALDLDNRRVAWGDIIGKPEAFAPAPHLHDIGDVYGFEYLVAQLEAIRQAILQGDVASHDEIYQYIDHQDAAIRGQVALFDQNLRNHTESRSNPHGVTKAQVQLGSVDNFATATKAIAEAGMANNYFMTPLRTKEAIMVFAGAVVSQHVGDYNNPHQVTKTQVGLGNVPNYGIATQAQAQQGTGDALMTPVRTAEAITHQVGTAFNNHAAARNNPHQVTAAQVGLGSVPNFRAATTPEAVEGANNATLMTPLTTAQAIWAQSMVHVQGHVNNYGNPHNVTKAQIGLGSVIDARQVIAGSNNLTLTWTGGVIRAIVDATDMGQIHTTSQPDPNLHAHLNNGNNPHGTNKWHVGLGQVVDMPVATHAQAVGGADHGSYMTPLRTKELMDAHAAGRAQFAGGSWGYWRDPSTGYTKCWGRTGLMAQHQAYYVYFRLRFTEIYSVTLGDVCHHTDNNNQSADVNVEMKGGVVARTLSTHGMTIIAKRISGANSDWVDVNYSVEGHSNGEGNGGSPGSFIAAPSNNHNLPWNWNGGYNGHSGAYIPGSTGGGVGGGGVGGGVGGGGVGGVGSDVPVVIQ